MPLTEDDVRKIATLARLNLTDEEVERYAAQLSDVLEYAERLNRVDTSEISPTASVLPLDAPLRTDEVRDCLTPEEALANAPETEDGMFRVPRVLG